MHSFAFSGGGIRGIAYIGCLFALENRGLLDYNNIDRISGTSIGSLFATLLAVGYTASEMQSEVLDADFNTFKEINISRFITNYGLDSGSKFVTWIETLLDRKIGNKDITFIELYTTKHVELIITGTCLNTRMVKYFSYKETPDLKIKNAIRISTAVPLLFTAVKYKNEYYVDGGILDNYPLDSIRKENTHEKDYLGFRLTMEQDQHTRKDINSLDEYLWNLISCILESSEDKYANNTNTVKIDTSNVSNSYQFGLDKQQKIALIKLGYKETIGYISSHIIDALD